MHLLCMAISIVESWYSKKLFSPLTTDWNIDQLNSCFPNFKRIRIMKMDDVMDDPINHFWTENLQMIDKPLVFIDLLRITEWHLQNWEKYEKNKEKTIN